MSEPRSDLTAVYRAEFSYVLANVLFRLGASGAEHEDLAQEVFTAAFNQWARFDVSRPVRPWLFGRAYRLGEITAASTLNRFEQEGLGAVEPANPGASAEEEVVRRQGLMLVERGLAAMELDRRAVFVMHEIDGHPIPAVSEALSIPLNTAYSRLRLARRDFNAYVSTLQPREGAQP